MNEVDGEIRRSKKIVLVRMLSLQWLANLDAKLRFENSEAEMTVKNNEQLKTTS